MIDRNKCSSNVSRDAKFIEIMATVISAKSGSSDTYLLLRAYVNFTEVMRHPFKFGNYSDGYAHFNQENRI